ncbi:MAG: D-hexose-6-phosphate mutarotase [Bacteroidota bacterium]|nr:D-hexose-6-phosphate mutarotase [Bacteroidota bacterium]
MIDIDELDDKFSIEGEIGFGELENDLVFVTVSNIHADADICLYGAHVTSFRPQNAMDILWMSPESSFEVGKPIRGGIPVCFPWFGPHKTDPEKPQHGFGRLMYWDMAGTATLPGGESQIRLQLCSSEETKAYWPHDFCAEMTFVVGRTLQVSLKVTNTSAKPFEYTCALHSYYNLSAIDNITIEGLQGTTYYNQLTGENGIQEEETLQIQEPMTRHYLDTEAPVVIADSVFRRRIKAEKTGSKVTTIWNPGEETCAKIGDLPDDAYHAFVCVEATNAFGFPIKLAPGESHETSAMIGLEE